MPEIDKDLYQALSLGLLLIAVIVLLAMLSTLSRVSKLLKDQLTPPEERPLSKDRPLDEIASNPVSEVSASAAEDEEEPELPLLASPPLGGSELEPITDEPEPAPSDDSLLEPLQSESAMVDEWGQRRVVEPGPLGGDESGADAFAGLAETPGPETAAPEAAAPEAAEPEAASPEPSGQAVDPFTGESAAASAAGAEEDDPFSQPAAASGATDDDPFGTGDSGTAAAASEDGEGAVASEDEEQPFELNGRWYFRRDGELLVYDEGTGEWVAAQEEEPESSTPSWDEPGSAEPAGASAFGESDTGADETAQFDSVEQAASEEPPAAGGFWKCPSCGAVNGSSASTCRMCFAARP